MSKNIIKTTTSWAGPTKNNHGPHLLRDFIAEVSSASVSPLIMACKRYLVAKVINNKVGGKGDEQ